MLDIEIRNLTLNDLDEMMSVEVEAWPPELRFTSENLTKILKTFPEGAFGVFVKNELGGVIVGEIVNYYPERNFTWYEITDDGNIVRTHNLNGDSLYTVSLGVSPRFGGKGCGTLLVKTHQQLTRDLNLQRMFLGARAPGYHEFSHMPIEEYLEMRKEGTNESYDPEIRFYERCGLKRQKIIPNYETDWSSLNYGVVMVWENPDYKQKT